MIVSKNDKSYMKIMLEELINISTFNDLKKFFSKYDVLIPVILSVKLKNRKLWLLSWKYIYLLQKLDDYNDFFLWLKRKGILDLKWFIDYMNEFFDDIINKNVKFNWEDDLTLIFGNLSFKDKLSLCKKIKIHSNKETKEFTQETCIESIYFFYSSKNNNLCDKIIFNEMMKNICKDFLDYF